MPRRFQRPRLSVAVRTARLTGSFARTRRRAGSCAPALRLTGLSARTRRPADSSTSAPRLPAPSTQARRLTRLLLPALLLPLLLACGAEPLVELDDDQRLRILRMSPVPETPPDTTNAWADDPAAARLGQFLFFDTRLSADGTISCASCHAPETGFSDGLPLAEGMGLVRRRSPTVWNTAHNRWFFWDGRADSQWSQALGPLESSVEHGFSRLGVAHLVHDDAELRDAYEPIFGALPDLSDEERFPPEGRPVPGNPGHPHQQAWASMDEADQALVTRIFVNVGKSIAAYQRQLVSRDAPFDRFVAGLRDRDRRGLEALTEQAQRGLALFTGRANCWLCHHDENLKDKEFHNLGFAPREGLPGDIGRFEGILELRESPFNAAGPYSDDPEGEAAIRLRWLKTSIETQGQFATPTLRNVAERGPFMHAGHFWTLEEVVRFYDDPSEEPEFGHRAEELVPLELTDGEVDDLVAFLESLTGAALPRALVEAPEGPR